MKILQRLFFWKWTNWILHLQNGDQARMLLPVLFLFTTSCTSFHANNNRAKQLQFWQHGVWWWKLSPATIFFLGSLFWFCFCLVCSRVGAHGAVACCDVVYARERAEWKGREVPAVPGPRLLSWRLHLLWDYLKGFEFLSIFIITTWFDSEFTFLVKYSYSVVKLQLVIFWWFLKTIVADESRDQIFPQGWKKMEGFSLSSPVTLVWDPFILYVSLGASSVSFWGCIVFFFYQWYFLPQRL